MAPGVVTVLRIVVARRLATLPLVLLAVAAMTFLLVAASPFDPISAYGDIPARLSEQTRQEILAAWNLDGSVFEQFGHWLVRCP